MKNFFAIFTIFFTLALSGCSISNNNQLKINNDYLRNKVGINASQTSAPTGIVSPANTESAEVATIAKNGIKLCQAIGSNLQFEYPNTWGKCSEAENKIYFRTDYEKYNVDLEVEVRNLTELSKTYPSYNKEYFDSFKNGGFDKVIIKNGEIFKVACGGALLCTGLILENNIYEINWSISSSQPVPKNLDGIWNPDHDVTQENIMDILKTAKKIK